LKRSSDVIVEYVQSEHNLLLGRRTASEVVRALVRVHLDGDDVRAEVRGRDLLTGLPKTIVLRRFELRDVIRRS
jgi:rod shape-determining protein MreB